MDETTIAETPGWVLVDAMIGGELSPLDVMEAYLGRIERLEPFARAFITIDPDGAMDQARGATAVLERGETPGPLHGLPVAVKDNLWTADMATTSGCLLFADEMPPADSITVERIRGAGGIVVGKTNMPEFAVWPRTVSRLREECVNPWDTDRVSGASSGGSAVAVATAMVPLAIGTDGGGSTRLPAALCGTVGVQPSKGVVPSWGRLGDGQFAGIGPMARDVRDAARLLTVIAGPDPRDPISDGVPVVDYEVDLDRGTRGCRIAWLPTMGDFEPDPQITSVLESALADLTTVGAHVGTPATRFDGLRENFWAINIGRSLFEGFASPLQHPDVLAAFGDPERRDLLSPYLVEMVEGTRSVSRDEYEAARAWRDVVRRRLDDLWEHYDVIATPTAPYVAPPRPADPWSMPWETMDHYITNTALANILRLTAVSVPAGFLGGLPVGLQLIGPRRSEALVLRVCHALERARPWSHVHPTVW